jgi:tRNA/rRNA methyltransferase
LAAEGVISSRMSALERLDRFCFVLVRPKSAGNIGAAARALKNMGFRDLRIVAPQSEDRRQASVMAVHAEDLLAEARIFPDLVSAISDCTITVGTTARMGKYRSELKPLRESAAALAGADGSNRIAIVFGPEDFGLTNEDLKMCQRLITIPAAPKYPSLNLAQAVMVTAYELRLAAGFSESAAREPFAPAAEVEAMLARIASALVAIGFLPENSPDHIMVTLRALFGRTGLYPRELDILNGIASQIRWAADGGFTTLEAKRRSGKRLR